MVRRFEQLLEVKHCFLRGYGPRRRESSGKNQQIFIRTLKKQCGT
jgi:hypothetical protein